MPGSLSFISWPIHKQPYYALLNYGWASFGNSDLSVLQIIEVVCCKLSPLQSDLYNHFIHSNNVNYLVHIFWWYFELGSVFNFTISILTICCKYHVKVKRAITEETKQSNILTYITALKKLSNHPKVKFLQEKLLFSKCLILSSPDVQNNKL